MTEQASFSIISFPGHKLSINYQALVFSAWLRTLRKGNAAYSNVPSSAYFSAYHQYIEKLLQKPDSLVKLAVLSDDHDVVLGFSVSREDVLDYIFVQPEQRGQKLCTILMPNPMTAFTHTTKLWHPIWQSKYKECEFKPRA